MIGNDTGVVIVDFKSAEWEWESSMLKARDRSWSSLFEKRTIEVGVAYFKSRELESEILSLKLGSGSRVRSRGKKSPTPQPCW